MESAFWPAQYVARLIQISIISRPTLVLESDGCFFPINHSFIQHPSQREVLFFPLLRAAGKEESGVIITMTARIFVPSGMKVFITLVCSNTIIHGAGILTLNVLKVLSPQLAATMLPLSLLNCALCKQNVQQTGTSSSVHIYSPARLIGIKNSPRGPRRLRFLISHAERKTADVTVAFIILAKVSLNIPHQKWLVHVMFLASLNCCSLFTAWREVEASARLPLCSRERLRLIMQRTANNF